MLISPGELKSLIEHQTVCVLDCRFDLARPDFGRQEYNYSHIPGAHYAHLDEHLSAPVVAGKTGRHPLPAKEVLELQIRSWGLRKDSTVVVYDHAKGAIAARAWWILRWAGISDVRLLDGGWQAWQAMDYPVTSEMPRDPISSFKFDIAHRPIVEMTDVVQFVDAKGAILIDARAATRYRGEHEPIDPVAGHIPGAKNIPWMINVDDAGNLLPPADIRLNFKKLGVESGHDIAIYCGSGVTACHLAFALEYSGMGKAILYPGSWSEWITNPQNQISTGTD